MKKRVEKGYNKLTFEISGDPPGFRDMMKMSQEKFGAIFNKIESLISKQATMMEGNPIRPITPKRLQDFLPLGRIFTCCIFQLGISCQAVSCIVSKVCKVTYDVWGAIHLKVLSTTKEWMSNCRSFLTALGP